MIFFGRSFTSSVKFAKTIMIWGKIKVVEKYYTYSIRLGMISWSNLGVSGVCWSGCEYDEMMIAELHIMLKKMQKIYSTLAKYWLYLLKQFSHRENLGLFKLTKKQNWWSYINALITTVECWSIGVVAICLVARRCLHSFSYIFQGAAVNLLFPVVYNKSEPTTGF